MSTKTVYTQNTLDVTTGELQEKVWITKKVENKEMFIRTYVDDICRLAKCNRSEQSFILASLKYLDYNTNELILTASRREWIANIGNMKMNTLNIAVSTLYKKGILIKVNKETYLNPKLFFFGSDIERNKCFALVIKYEIISLD